MSFKQYLKELMMPASTLSSMSVAEDKHKSKKNTSDKSTIFPSDEEIDIAINSADKAFWKVIIDIFRNRINSIDFKPSEEIKNLNISMKNAVKKWLKDNWSDISNIKNIKTNQHQELIKPSQKSFEPPGTPFAGTEARI